MRVLVTGAAGFVGRALVRRLLDDPRTLGPAASSPARSLVLIDKRIDTPAHAGEWRVHIHQGDIADPRLLRRALVDGIDTAFHLASVSGGTAERDYGLGRRVNLDATFELFEQLAEQPAAPRVVFASSVAVYGAPLPDVVNARTPLRPALSYGAHKLMAEVWLADFTRRGWLDGVSLRLPGIVARPPEPSGLVSAYMSDIIRRLAAGEHFVCPVSAQAMSWWMSARCCVDNLLHAARLQTRGMDPQRAWPLPVLHFSMAELVENLAQVYGADRAVLVSYEPQERVEAVFGRYPPLDASDAQALGFAHDGSIEALLRHALSNGNE